MKRDEEESIKVILVGPLADYYGDAIHKCVKDFLWSSIELIKEQVTNEKMDIKNRSSALQHMCKSGDCARITEF